MARLKFVFSVFAVAFSICAMTSAHATPLYTITDLGTLDGSNSAGTGVNIHGQVSGVSDTYLNLEEHAFIWDEIGGMFDLGIYAPSHSTAADINDSGQVVGNYRTHSAEQYAFIGDATGLTNLGTLGGSSAYGRGINNIGQIAGQSLTTSGEWHAFIGDEVTGLTDIGTLGGDWSNANDINDLGQAVGRSRTGVDYQQHAFIGDATGLTDLGTLGGDWATANGVNNLGLVTGYSRTDTGALYAFIGDATGLISLGTLSGYYHLGGFYSYGYDINDLNQVVGASHDTSHELHAILWDEVNGMMDLNDLVVDLTGWDYLSYAFSISNTGYITGVGMTEDGDRHAYLLTLVDSEVPEPASLALLGFSLLGLSLVRRRRVLSC